MSDFKPLLASTPNFRDLGGYVASCGRSVRRGMLYRSEDFSNLTPEDAEQLQRLGIRVLCDLRSDRERQLNPNKWQAADALSLNISVDLRAGHAIITHLLSGTPNREHAEQAMLETYRLFPAAFANQVPQLFQRILDHQRLPMVFHCAAGKDRTGFVAALLLSALGVPRDEINADYLLTAERWNGPRSEIAIRAYLAPLCDGEPSIEVIRTLCGVSPRYLNAAFEAIDRHYGGMDDYLESAGVDSHARKQLANLLLG
ncbi:Tyrosine-protein phosphatase [compost metagenome]